MDDRPQAHEASVGYSFGFYREMAPAWLDLCVGAADHALPPRTGSFRYLELGCGQGFGLCLLAAANPEAEFVGVDFQPDHIDHARDLAESAGLTNVRFVCADFADLASDWPSDFGTFDYVTLHGILSWVSAEVRAAVVDCLATATHAGSLVYASYNAQPSWLGSMPFQHFTRLLERTTGNPPQSVIEQSIGLFERLRSANAAIFKVLPALDARLQTLRAHGMNYLIHEYLAADWQPLWHSQVARDFGRAGLEFVGSATIADNLLPEVLAEPLQTPIGEQRSEELRQDVQDFALNQGFRRDIFRRGNASGAPADSAGDTRMVLLTRPPAGGNIPVQTSFGQLALQERDVAPIIDALANGPRPVRDLVAASGLPAASFEQLLILLLHADTIGVVPAQKPVPEAAARLNAAIARAACQGAPYRQLAAAALGSAIRVSEIELMLLDCWLAADCMSDVAALADGVWQRMSRLGRKLYRDEQRVEGAEAAIGLRTVAASFIDDIVPRWRELGAVA